MGNFNCCHYHICKALLFFFSFRDNTIIATNIFVTIRRNDQLNTIYLFLIRKKKREKKRYTVSPSFFESQSNDSSKMMHFLFLF